MEKIYFWELEKGIRVLIDVGYDIDLPSLIGYMFWIEYVARKMNLNYPLSDIRIRSKKGISEIVSHTVTILIHAYIFNEHPKIQQIFKSPSSRDHNCLKFEKKNHYYEIMIVIVCKVIFLFPYIRKEQSTEQLQSFIQGYVLFIYQIIIILEFYNRFVN